MSFESQSVNNSSHPENQKKVSTLSIILIFLTLLAGTYLAYSIYNTNRSSNNTKSEPVTLGSKDINSDISKVSSSQNIKDLSKDSSNTMYTLSQIEQKNNKTSCWTIIGGYVYDITSYIPNHPGGEKEILQICGKDGSQLFSKPQEHKDEGASNVLDTFKIGTMSQ
jgi:cytochrome b involved in lipid metabolism